MTMETKFIVLIILVAALLAVWLVPRTRPAQRLTFSEGAYRLVHWIGALSAASGLVVTFVLGSSILDTHVYEIVLLPVLFAYAVYPAIVARVRKTDELLDEKQLWDTTRAAALSLTATTLSLSVVYAFYDEGALTGTVWYPILMFSVVGWYSAGTLFLHGRS